MLPNPPQTADVTALTTPVREAVAQRFQELGEAAYGMSLDHFEQIVTAVVVRYAGEAPLAEQLEILGNLRIEELILARACSAGNNTAWECFLTRYRAPLYDTAHSIAQDDATARELADGLYGDLFGIPGESGQRRSKLDYYMGRGSLEGWLRTVLSQEYVNRYRAQRKDVSLEEQVEAGASFVAKPEADVTQVDERVSQSIAETLLELEGEERFLLVSYFLDQRTLAEIGSQLSVHESTISRKLERLTGKLRKQVRRRLQAKGMNTRRCDEILEELDVRDLNIDVERKLKQESPIGAFYKKDGSAK